MASKTYCTTCRGDVAEYFTEDDAEPFRWCRDCGTLYLGKFKTNVIIPRAFVGSTETARTYATFPTKNLREFYAAFTVDYGMHLAEGNIRAASFCALRLGIIEGVLTGREEVVSHGH